MTVICVFYGLLTFPRRISQKRGKGDCLPFNCLSVQSQWRAFPELKGRLENVCKSLTASQSLYQVRKRRKCFANQISANLESFRRLLQKSVGNIDASLIGLCWIAHQWLQGCVRVNALPKLIYCRGTLQPRNHWCEISLSPASGELMFTTHFFRTKLSRFGGTRV